MVRQGLWGKEKTVRTLRREAKRNVCPVQPPIRYDGKREMNIKTIQPAIIAPNKKRSN